jgi:TPR repeat protein
MQCIKNNRSNIGNIITEQMVFVADFKAGMKRAFNAIVAAIILLSFAAPVAATPFEDAVAAYGRGDYETALRLWRPLADQGLADSQNSLGVMYESGHGVPQDDAEAVKWYRLAANQGYATAQSNLGIMYNNGQGVPQDYFEAHFWWFLAANQDDATAQYNLGLTSQNYAEAVSWYRKAADQGLAPAQYNLGNLYFKGLGVPQDYVRAHMWLNLAAAQGVQPAAENRDIAARRMTPAQIAEAQKLAREWKPKLER